MTIGVALSGGGIRGASHIGALRALEEAELRPHMIAGSSIGSVVASLYAAGIAVDEIERVFLKYAPWILDINFTGILRALLCLCPFLKSKPAIDGLIKGNNAERIMHNITGGKMMHQTKIPLAVTATDINDGTPVIFVSDWLKGYNANNVICCRDVLISEAVRASIAIPVIFKPKTIDIREKVRRLVDGGVTNNLPMDVLRAMGARSIIGINLGYSGKRQEQVGNIMEIGSQTIDIMMYHITKLKNSSENVVELKSKGRSVLYTLSMNREAVVVNPQIYDVSLFDTKKIPQLIERGYDAIKGRIPEIKKILKL